MKRITFDVPRHLAERFKQEAKGRNIDQSKLLAQIIDETKVDQDRIPKEKICVVLQERQLEYLQKIADQFKFRGKAGNKTTVICEILDKHYSARKKMKIDYYPETDSIYIEFTDADSIESKEVEPGIVFDYDADGNVTGIDIDSNASEKMNLPEIEYKVHDSK